MKQVITNKLSFTLSFLIGAQIGCLILKFWKFPTWNWWWALTPLWLIASTFIGVALAGFIRGIIGIIKIYHKCKLYRISKLPKPTVDGFFKEYIENEFEEQLKNYPDRNK